LPRLIENEPMNLKRAFVRSMFDRYFRWRLPDLLAPAHPIILDYVDFPVASPEPRYGFGKAPHMRLYDRINEGRSRYAEQLRRLCAHRDCFANIAVSEQSGSCEPYWENTYFSDLDAMALYGMLTERNPRLYVEVGSGNSTKFARRAINDQRLGTRLMSIDPMPRAEIGDICDEIIRMPFEQLDLSVLDQIEAGDFLFIDNSHLAFANSDVTSFFLDVYPRLRPGIVLQIHDVLLPYDYPPQWAHRYYSEQYLLACHLLATPQTQLPTILLANAFISQDTELNALAAEICRGTNLNAVFERSQPARRWSPPHRGVSIWMETT